LFVAFFLVAVPLRVSATSIGEYQKNLQKAINALDTLGEIDESERAVDTQKLFVETLNLIRTALPAKQTIDVEGSTYEVDNSPLHKLLNDLEKADAADRDRLRLLAIDSLKSISERIDELEKAKVSNAASKEESNRKLKEILSRSEYASKSKQGNALLRLLDRFLSWLAQFLPQPSEQKASKGSPLTVVAQILVVALAAAVIIFAGLKLIKVFGRSRTTKTRKSNEPRIVLGEKLEPDASASDLLSDAEAMARAGDIRAAIRKAYIALLVELGDRKVISLAQHKTNRDYLRSVSNLPTLYRNLTGLTNSFERHWYGFVETGPADWQNFKTAYQAALRSNE